MGCKPLESCIFSATWQQHTLQNCEESSTYFSLMQATCHTIQAFMSAWVSSLTMERAKPRRSSDRFPQTTNMLHGIFFLHAKFWWSTKRMECLNTHPITFILLILSYLSPYHFESFACQPALVFPTPPGYWKFAPCKALSCQGKSGYLTWQQPKMKQTLLN